MHPSGAKRTAARAAALRVPARVSPFFHEAGHLLLHSKKELFIDGDPDDLHRQEEDEANAFAAHQLIPRGYESRLPQLQTDTDVRAFADELGIAPGLVVGRLHKRSYGDWKRGNHLREKIDFAELLDIGSPAG